MFVPLFACGITDPPSADAQPSIGSVTAGRGGPGTAKGKQPAAPNRFAAALTAGRAVVREIQFAANSDEIAPSSLPYLKLLAKAINATSGHFLIEGHVDDTGDPANNQALSERRAAAVKERLVLEGIPPGRLFAVGYGATRPVPGAAGERRSARIEVARMH